MFDSILVFFLVFVAIMLKGCEVLADIITNIHIKLINVNKIYSITKKNIKLAKN